MENYTLLAEYLKTCTVRIQNSLTSGTGFFVGPGQILTCAHVAYPPKRDIQPILIPNTIFYGDKKFENILVMNGEAFPQDPDLALLRLDFHDHPCVAFSKRDVRATEVVYAYGYPAENVRGMPVTADCEGTTGDMFIRMKLGQISHGFSGSPILNLSDGFVCGVLMSTRGAQSILGGEGIPVSKIQKYFPGVYQANLDFHMSNDEWEIHIESAGISTVQSGLARIFIGSGSFNKPRPLFGRESLLEKIYCALQTKRHVLLAGMGGIGKTALAEEISYRFVQNNQCVIWLDVGRADADSIIESLAFCCENLDDLSGKQGSNKILALRKMLTDSGVTLIIMDNVRNVSVLDSVCKAFPEQTAILFTARTSFYMEEIEIIEVDQLDLEASLQLLASTVGVDHFQGNRDAEELCSQLGNHPYAIQIAGGNIKVLRSSPKLLLNKLEQIVFSSEFDSTGKRSTPYYRQGYIRAILEDDLKSMSEEANRILMAFGAFWKKDLTTALLAVFLDKNREDLEGGLNELRILNLLTTPHGSEPLSIHDLTYGNVSLLFREKQKDHLTTVSAVEKYLNQFCADHDLLQQDMPNILQATKLAEGELLLRMVSVLVLGGYPFTAQDSYVDSHGFPRILVEQLQRAIGTAAEASPLYDENLHYLYGKLGNYSFNEAQFDRAVIYYQKALELSPDLKRKARLLCVTAKALASAGRKEESRNHFEEAYKAANQIPDDHDKDIMLCIILEQECLVAGESGEYARARDVAMKQVEISERCSLSNPNNRQTFFAYLNRGSAELDLAKIGKGDFSTALQNHLRALDIATALDNDIFKALVLNNLGEDSFHLGQKKSAKENFYKALSLWKQLERTKDEKELESLIIKYGLPLPKQQPRKAIKSGGSS